MKIQLLTIAATSLFLCACSLVTPSAPDDGQVTLDYLQDVAIFNGQFKAEAKLDTGADNCSMGATNITPLEIDGKKWVRFDLDKRFTGGKVVTLKHRIVRVTEIVRHDSEPQKRYVIKVDMNIKGIHQEVNVSLTDRSGYTKPVLIGRNFLNGYVIVRSSVRKGEGSK